MSASVCRFVSPHGSEMNWTYRLIRDDADRKERMWKRIRRACCAGELTQTPLSQECLGASFKGSFRRIELINVGVRMCPSNEEGKRGKNSSCHIVSDALDVKGTEERSSKRLVKDGGMRVKQCDEVHLNKRGSAHGNVKYQDYLRKGMLTARTGEKKGGKIEVFKLLSLARTTRKEPALQELCDGRSGNQEGGIRKDVTMTNRDCLRFSTIN